MGGIPVKNSDWELQMEPLYAVGELGFANAREEWSGVSLQVANGYFSLKELLNM